MESTTSKSQLEIFKSCSHEDIKSRSPPPHTLEINHEGITHQLLPFFILLRFFGRCPLKFESGVEVSGVSCPGQGSSSGGFKRVTYVYRASWKERSFILSLLSATFFASSFTFLICQTGSLGFQLFPSDSVWPDSLMKRRELSKITGKFVYVVLLTFEIGYAVQGVIEYFLAWVTASQLAEWLTQWNSIESQLGINCTNSSAALNLKKFRNYLMLYYTAVPVALFGTILMINNGLNSNHPIFSFFLVIYGYGATMCNINEDVKLLLMCKTIEMTFRQVRLQVEERSSNSSWDFELSKGDTIRDWHRLLISIRKQAAVAGKYSAAQQLLAIGISVYFSSSALFVAANIIGKEGARGVILKVVTFSLISFSRVVFKIATAHRITEQESLLAVLIKDMELVEQNQKSQNELKSIYDLLSSQPTVISLNNFVTLNNSLILSVCGQVLTHFIVFMQFQNPK